MDFDFPMEQYMSIELGRTGDAALKEENKWLRERLVELTTLKEQERLNRVQVQAELAEKERRVRKLERTRHRLRTQVKVQDGTISDVQSEMVVTQAKHTEEKQEVGGLNDKMKQMLEEARLLRVALQTKEGEKEKLQSDLEREHVAVSVAAAETATLQQEIVHFRAIVGRLQTLCERLREAYNAAKREAKEQALREEEIKTELTHTMVIAEEQKRENQVLAGMMRKQNAEALKMEKEREELHDRLLATEAQVVEQEPIEHVSAETHRQEQRELEEKLRKMQRELERVQTEAEEAEQAKAELLVKVVDLRGRVQLLESNVESLSKLNNDLEQQVLQERERGEQYASMSVDATGKHCRALEQVDLFQKDLERKERLMQNLQEEYDDHMRLWAQDKESLRKKEDELSRLQGYFMQVKHMLERRQQLARERAASPGVVAEREQLERKLALRQESARKRPSVGTPGAPEPPPDSDSTPSDGEGSYSEESEESEESYETEGSSVLPSIPSRSIAPHPPSVRGGGRPR
eukprot:Hpha_TRINITY_DN16515_c1_g3::TRINITY_DN16515_c1_g3_i1::g.133828::m.133828